MKGKGDWLIDALLGSRSPKDVQKGFDKVAEYGHWARIRRGGGVSFW